MSNHKEHFEEVEERAQGAGNLAKLILGVVFLPGYIAAYGVYFLFRFKRNRTSVLAKAAAVISLVAIGILAFAAYALSPESSFEGQLPYALLWVGASLTVGPWVGWRWARNEVRRMEEYPYLTELAGSWFYGFEFKLTPKERKKRKALEFALRDGELIEEGRSPLGMDEKTGEVVYRYDSEAIKHTLATGASGAGKTVTMMNLVLSDIVRGKTLVFIDFKSDPEIASKLSIWADENGRKFRHFTNGSAEDYDIPKSAGQSFYDPLKNGTPTSRQSMLLNMREYDSNAAVYKQAMQELLTALFKMIEEVDRNDTKNSTIDWDHGGLELVASILRGNNLNELAAACSKEVAPGSTPWTYTAPGSGGITGARTYNVNTSIAKEAIELVEALRSKGPKTQALDELRGQVRTMLLSEAGQWLRRPEGNAEREIDLFELTKTDGNVVLFSISGDSERDFARFFGSTILSDFDNVSALRRAGQINNQINLYIDEFQALPPSSVTNLLEKARGSGIAVTLSLQSFEQIVAEAQHNGEAYLGKILDTCSNFISHAGSVEDSAVRLSKLLGKEWRTVYAMMGSGRRIRSLFGKKIVERLSKSVSTSNQEFWVFPPEEFMRLSLPESINGYKSTMVYTTKTSSDPKYAGRGGAVARTVWVIASDKVINKYYERTSTRDNSGSLHAKKLTPTPQEPEEFIQPIYTEPEPVEYVYAELPNSTQDEEWGFVEVEETVESPSGFSQYIEPADDRDLSQLFNQKPLRSNTEVRAEKDPAALPDIGSFTASVDPPSQVERSTQSLPEFKPAENPDSLPDLKF